MRLVEEKVLIGTSGWGYDEWVGPFYPKSLNTEDFLVYYSNIFYTNEINTTFYNIPSRRVVDNWINKTPENFLFSVKIPKIITHKNKLDLSKCSDELNYFLKVTKPLIESKKLISYLIQLPPSFKKDGHFGYLKDFVKNWPGEREKEGYYLVIEFRHDSWLEDEVFSYLKNNSLTYCAVIEPLLPPRMDVTNPKFSYIRFHGYGKKIWFNYFFKEEEIKKWAIPIRDVIKKSEKVGIYFNNHFSGYAAKNSLMMMGELEIKPRNDPKTLKILDVKKKSRTELKGQTSLDKFIK